MSGSTSWYMLAVSEQTVFFAKPLARLREVDRSGAMLLNQKPHQLLPVAEELEGNSFQSEPAKNDITFGMRESNCLRRACSPAPFPS